MILDKVSRRQFMKAGGIGLLGAFAARANAPSNQDGIATFTSALTLQAKAKAFMVTTSRIRAR